MSTTPYAWATAQFGLRLHDGADASDGERLSGLVQPGLRRNPRRAHLLVSTVLGKHIAVSPTIVRDAGRRLGDVVAALRPGATDVLGMAETATGLGHCVADQIDAAVYLHSTRRSAPPEHIYAGFQEGHSHATDHLLQPVGPETFGHSRTLVIVDDEISTGNTALATIEALHRRRARPHYIVASLVDVRTDAHRRQVDTTAHALQTAIDFVSLTDGQVSIPDTLTEQVCALPAPRLNPVDPDGPGSTRTVALPWPDDVPDGGRHGFLRSDGPAFSAAVVAAAAHLTALLDPARPVLVIGHEELMYLPLRIAEHLAAYGFSTRFQSSTRSPAYVVDDPGYPLRTGFEFPAGESGEIGFRYLYNGWPAGSGAGRTQAVVVMDASAAVGADGLTGVLATAGYDVLGAVVDGPGYDALVTARGRA
ncbi:phosphoribosyltransferase family protein [Mycolicibacterium llatzerense]|uniref:phosphoribosyltransferase family protein n=1 Tax=Mycolicibacterium llatzerense TaxID=280871 RepID=UPI0008DD8D09|nr:phosphoribosyltransferase family protein [Mycolicibacterium llatzerense]